MRSSASLANLSVIIAVGGLSVLGAPSARAFPPYLTAFNSAYPTSTLGARMISTLGSACYVCHQPPDTSANGNCYKVALASRIDVGRTIAQAIADIDNADSDNDGVSNHVEILAARADLPGQVGYNPGLIGATGTDPCSGTPSAAVTNKRETPCRADFNNDGSLLVSDIFAFLAAWFAGDPSADFNGSGAPPTVQDIFAFLTAWFAGCP